MVKMIDNYTLLQVIGEGNYGKVYRAKNIKTNQQYAIKIIPSDKLHQNTKLQECTMNEVQTLTTIGQTEHIIMYYEMLKTKNNYYFVYEFCNGGTLMELLSKEHHLDQIRALDIFKQLLQAFKVLNRLNIMHRDLKPENIFFSDNKVKLGDFGFCKGLRPEENLTKTMLGSPIYMAPQVLKGQAYSTKADIWSLGVILYEMLYGVCPFQSSSIAMLINTINSHDIILPSNIKVSEKTQHLLKKLLTKDYFRRIGWIQLFNWFGQSDSGQLTDNVFKSTSLNNNRASLEKKVTLVQQWATKNKFSDLSSKQRSVSQDITKKQKTTFDMGSLQNISPKYFQHKNTRYTPKMNEQIKTGQNSEILNKDLSSQQKAFSSMRSAVGGTSPFQIYRKTGSVPKPQNIVGIQQNILYGNSSSFKQQSNRNVFYSQKYQSVFTSPILQKSPKINENSLEIAEKQTNDLQETIQSNSHTIQSITTLNKPNIVQRLSINKNSMANSRANNSAIASKNLKQQKIQDSKIKRKQCMQIHEECLNALKETLKRLQQSKEKYLKVAYFILTSVLQRLRQITRFINIAQIDLLDISSLISYEIIQVQKMIIDLKEQLENNNEQLPNNFDEVKQLISDQKNEEKIIREFIFAKKAPENHLDEVSLNQNKIQEFPQPNLSTVNITIKSKQEEKDKQDSIILQNDEFTVTPYNRFSKGQYYTTNEFTEYYKNLVEKREKNSNPKISMFS